MWCVARVTCLVSLIDIWVRLSIYLFVCLFVRACNSKTIVPNDLFFYKRSTGYQICRVYYTCGSVLLLRWSGSELKNLLKDSSSLWDRTKYAIEVCHYVRCALWRKIRNDVTVVPSLVASLEMLCVLFCSTPRLRMRKGSSIKHWLDSPMSKSMFSIWILLHKTTSGCILTWYHMQVILFARGVFNNTFVISFELLCL